MATASDVKRELLRSDTEHNLSELPSQASSRHMLQDIATLLDTKLEQTFSSFKRSIEDKDVHHASEIKKLKSEAKASNSFKFPGNRVQFEFNDILDGVDNCTKALLDGDLAEANTILQSLTTKLNKRNKLIRFADKSPAGWNAVDEYESDELAENSKDEKKLRSAERRALSRMKFKSTQSKMSKATATSTRSTPSSTQQTPTERPSLPQQPFRSYPRSFRNYGRYSPTDKCFSCGPSATGLGRPNVSTSTVQINANPTHPDTPGQLLAEHGHKLAANRLCENEYINYLCSDMHNRNSPNASVCPETETSELVQGAQVVNVKGRLRACVQFWESISAPPFVLSVIREGYKIPFLHTPPRAFFPSNKSSHEHNQFVASAIKELLRVGSVLECPTPPTVVNPLSVSVQSNGKKRLILDLRYPNTYIKKSHVKFEDAKAMLGLLANPAQYWMFSFDIKSGYHHIDIHASDQQFLGFAWVFDSNPRYFVFTVLPFGQSTGPYIFTKVIRPLVKHWRSKAIRIVVYLDDGLGASSTFDAATKQSLSVRADLVASGFVPNCDKCQWSPTQQLTWLGLDWDLLNQVLKIPARRVTRLLTEIEALADHTKCKTTITARKLASVAGLIMSNSLVFGNICTGKLNRANSGIPNSY